jgi:hypothetical protein
MITKPSEEVLDLSSGRYLNESAIHAHALQCSKSYRAGKFTRVGGDFVDEVKADVEALIREIRGKYKTLHPALSLSVASSNSAFTTGALSDRVMAELNNAIGRLIQNKVQRQPSCGKTLGRTR